MKQSDFRYKVVGEYIHLQFDSKPDYSIAIAELGRVLKDNDQHYPGLSDMVRHMYKKGNVDRKWCLGFQNLIQTLVPENKINWESTNKYLDVEEARERLRKEYKAEQEPNAPKYESVFDSYDKRQKDRDAISQKLAEEFPFLKN